MSIKAIGAKHAYVYIINAFRRDGELIRVGVGHAMDAADSDHEARENAMRIAVLYYPASEGWEGHDASVVRISGIDAVSSHELTPDERAG